MILAIQFRTDQSGPHEVNCIYEAGGIPYNTYSFINANSEGISQLQIKELADAADAVLLGGKGEGGYEADTSAERQAHENIRKKMLPVIRELVESGKPMMGMCFGHQLIADALGVDIAQPSDEKETGIAKITLTEKGQNDPLLAGFNDSFHAVVGHKSSIAELPDSATHLAYTDKHKWQAFRINNTYSFQFHPELSYQHLVERLAMYPEYTDNQIDYDPDVEIEAHKILKQFVQALFLPKSESFLYSTEEVVDA